MSDVFTTSMLRTLVSENRIASQFYATCTARSTIISGDVVGHNLILDLAKMKSRTYPQLNLRWLVQKQTKKMLVSVLADDPGNMDKGSGRLRASSRLMDPSMGDNVQESRTPQLTFGTSIRERLVPV